MYDTCSAASIAIALSGVPHISPMFTDPLSRLDKAVAHWLIVYPQLTHAHREFGQARRGMWPSIRTDESVRTMHSAALKLATQMEALGDVRISICGATTKQSMCMTTLVAGQCRHSSDHIS